MPVNIVSRVAARAVIPAALAAGSLSLAATAAGACASSAACGGAPPPVVASRACTTPDCIRGVPPAAAPTAMKCTDPRCVSGTPGRTAPAGNTSRGHGGQNLHFCAAEGPQDDADLPRLRTSLSCQA